MLSKIFSITYPVKSRKQGTVHKVGKDDESFSLLEVEKEDGGDEGHALHVAEVRPVADVGAQQVPQRGVVGPALLQ